MYRVNSQFGQHLLATPFQSFITFVVEQRMKPWKAAMVARDLCGGALSLFGNALAVSTFGLDYGVAVNLL